MILDPEFRLLPWSPDPPESCDPLGLYAETYWLPILGPAAWAMGRRFVSLHQRAAGAVLVLDGDEIAGALGLETWRYRAVLTAEWLAAHHLVRCRGTANLEVRIRWPRLASRYLQDLPVKMQQAEPDHWLRETQPVQANAGLML